MKYFKSLLVIVALFAINSISAQSISDKWPQMRDYQDLLTKTYRDALKGDLKPIKGNAETLVQFSEALNEYKFPDHIARTEELANKIIALKNDTKALNDIINSKGTNDAIMKAFNKLNATNKALNAPSSKPAKK
ncbi:hypothetical protein [uncultured Flavobacterium sp.]|uniref:hypothetical protein n=2 Tax=Flavobacteriaceae TaxID=49546 RepID=UPI00086E7B90|nr:hypothetical protein [uncultured Flavobacterium sp.]MBN9282938.1 hypothetical protein [Flavobacterium sp.]ODS79930.1 MAG: hypothetical protein ABS44_20955 [Chryseobacterium sp. SCN 40-13]OJV67575.1 MAG: hypothetical protein BGO42_16205 [Flavobacterium sp. 40-81]